ncbi:kinase-like domain-containing protein [Mycena vulgaris]|nr:kinase-like domain-containing protein [Mycena vulgaris]
MLNQIPNLSLSVDTGTGQDLLETAKTLGQLSHPNILPLLGVSLDLGVSLALVSPLCISGPIAKYLRRSEQDMKARFRMATGVARGLSYLHSRGIIHGNLCTASEILVDFDGSPVISGYGLSTVFERPDLPSSIRFTSPESFTSAADGPSTTRTSSGDVYAFSMVAFEIMSGLEPYHHLATNAYDLVLNIISGGRPVRSHSDQLPLPKRMWKLLTLLWGQVPSQRPGMPDALQALAQMCILISSNHILVTYNLIGKPT